MSEQCMICSLPAPDGDDWQGHHERISTLERQLAEAQDRGVFLWRTLKEWLLLQQIFGGSASEEHTAIARLQETITETERQKAELNRVLHPKGDGPPAPAWCDLIAFVEGDLARLQERVEEAEARLRKANCDYGDGWIRNDLECGVDAEPWCGKHAVLYYKALAERRKEALIANISKCGEEDCGNIGVWMWWNSTDVWHMCDDHKSTPIPTALEGPELDDDAVLARAAIEEGTRPVLIGPCQHGVVGGCKRDEELS